jgi:hypothetical protein
MLTIQREDKEWGVRLFIRPFADPAHAMMEISSEVAAPRPNRNPEIRLWFSSVPIQHPLKRTEVVIWIESIKAILSESQKVSVELKGKKSGAKRLPKKS